MSFPVTRHSLIQRLATTGTGADWEQFHHDYWGAICRFARRIGGLSEADAEEVAAQTFEAILTAKLLERWTESRTAKLRTLICAVARNCLANRRRLIGGREQLVAEHADELQRFRDEASLSGDPADDQFYAAWVDEILYRAFDQLCEEYNAVGRGDYFRVFFSRLSEEMPFADIADSLEITPAAADNYFRHAGSRFSEILHQLVRDQVRRYVDPGEVEQEFRHEWTTLGAWLEQHGGIEAAIRVVHANSITGE